MKKKLIQAIEEIISLLDCCKNGKYHVGWFLKRLNNIKKLKENSEEFKKELTIIYDNLRGMGSFHDTRLIPKKQFKIFDTEITNKQWELIEKLGEIIDSYLASKP